MSTRRIYSALILIGLGFMVLTMTIDISGLIKLLNQNQGVVAAIGFFIVIPIAILREKILSFFRSHNRREELRQILLKELYYNLNHVSQIEESYNTQLGDSANLHIPHHPPRTEILEEFCESDYLTSLTGTERKKTIEIFAQLQVLKREFSDWKQYLLTHPYIIEDAELYKLSSSSMMTYINPVMENMLSRWLHIVEKSGKNPSQGQIRRLNRRLNELIKEGNDILPTYKTSMLNLDGKNASNWDVIMCWWDDANLGTEKQVIEIADDLNITKETVSYESNKQ